MFQCTYLLLGLLLYLFIATYTEVHQCNNEKGTFPIHPCIPSSCHSLILPTNSAIDCCVGLMCNHTGYSPELFAAWQGACNVLDLQIEDLRSSQRNQIFNSWELPSHSIVLMSTLAPGRLPSTPPTLQHQAWPLFCLPFFSELSKKYFITRWASRLCWWCNSVTSTSCRWLLSSVSLGKMASNTTRISPISQMFRIHMHKIKTRHDPATYQDSIVDLDACFFLAAFVAVVTRITFYARVTWLVPRGTLEAHRLIIYMGAWVDIVSPGIESMVWRCIRGELVRWARPLIDRFGRIVSYWWEEGNENIGWIDGKWMERVKGW